MTTYRVVLDGGTLQGFAIDDVRRQLAALIGRSEEVAAKLLSGHPSKVKAGIDEATALRYVEALKGIGVACHLEQEVLQIDVEPEPTTPRPVATSTVASNSTTASRPVMNPQVVVATPDQRSKQGAVIGGWICLALGTALMFWTLFSFLLYVPLFFAAFVLGIVAIAQRRVGNGISILLLSVIVPLVIGFGLAAYRTGSALSTVHSGKSIAAGVADKRGCTPADFTVSGINFSSTGVSGKLYMRGTIKNNCDSPAGVQHKISFYDKAGNLLFVQDAWFASITNIPSHSDWPFQTIVSVDRFDSYTIQAIDSRTW